MNKPFLTRYEFLKLAGRGLLWIGGALGLGGLVRFLSYEPAPPAPTKFEIGSQSNYPMNSHTVLADIPAIIVHDQSGFSAYSLICTHLGCTVEVKPSAFTCPCHGSRYNSAGEVTKGPAALPLQAMQIELTSEDELVVYRG